MLQPSSSVLICSQRSEEGIQPPSRLSSQIVNRLTVARLLQRAIATEVAIHIVFEPHRPKHRLISFLVGAEVFDVSYICCSFILAKNFFLPVIGVFRPTSYFTLVKREAFARVQKYLCPNGQSNACSLVINVFLLGVPSVQRFPQESEAHLPLLLFVHEIAFVAGRRPRRRRKVLKVMG